MFIIISTNESLSNMFQVSALYNLSVSDMHSTRATRRFGRAAESSDGERASDRVAWMTIWPLHAAPSRVAGQLMAELTLNLNMIHKTDIVLLS